MPEKTYDPPAIGDLVWEADRVSLLDLDDATRALLEKIGDTVAALWPDDVDVTQIHEDAKDEALVELGRELAAEALGIDPERDALPDSAESITAAVKKCLEHERAEGEKDATIPSRANTAERKAMRLLLERRVTVIRREIEGPFAGLIHAKVKGDSDTYDCGFDPRQGGKWRCTCPEMRGDCSHLAAVKMVVA